MGCLLLIAVFIALGMSNAPWYVWVLVMLLALCNDTRFVRWLARWLIIEAGCDE